MDDESKPENPLFDKDVNTPDKWNDIENPSYAYYQYYIYANMTVLNQFRRYLTMLIKYIIVYSLVVYEYLLCFCDMICSI